MLFVSISDKTKKSLEKVGLTSYEIRAYTTMLKIGESNASEISQNSGVPYSKIYEILGALEEKGWIGSDDARPTKYFAKAPSNALETTKAKRRCFIFRKQKCYFNRTNSSL